MRPVAGGGSELNDETSQSSFAGRAVSHSRPRLRSFSIFHFPFLCVSVANRIYWRAMIPFIHFGPILVPTFGLMIAAAMLVAYYVLRADMARRGLAAKDTTTAEIFVAVPALVGIVGAKLYHVLETPRELFADPVGQLFSRYGLAWFGGLIAGFAAFVWLARRHKFPLLEMFRRGLGGRGDRLRRRPHRMPAFGRRRLRQAHFPSVGHEFSAWAGADDRPRASHADL